MDASTFPTDSSRDPSGAGERGWRSYRRRLATPGSSAGFLLRASVVVLAGLVLYAGGRVVQTGYEREQAKWASLINAAGGQRMRSQRVALLALRLVHAETDSTRGWLRGELLGTIERAAAVQGSLLDPGSDLNPPGMPSPSVRRLYREPPHRLRTRTDSFLEAARRVAEAAVERPDGASEELPTVLRTAPALLAGLDRGVTLSEAAAREALLRFQHRSLAALVGFVVVALALALFWIQPKLTSLRRRADERARRLFDAAPVGLLLVGEDGRIREANARMEEMFGFGDRGLDEVEMGRLLPELGSRRCRLLRASAFGGTGAAFRPEPGGDGRELPEREGAERDVEERGWEKSVEVEGIRNDGTSFPVHCVLRPFDRDGERCLLCGISDLSEEQQLRSWGVDTVRETEEERHRIARDLHDEMAQRMATLQVQTRAALRAGDESRRRELLESVARQLAEGTDATRRIIRGLRPMELDQLGLAAAIQAHVRQRLDGAEPEVEVRVEDVESRLDADRKLACYRILQEAIANALRHAEASRLVISLRDLGQEGVELAVEDDGQGFEPDEVARGVGAVGLRGMRERAGAAGGRLELESEPGRGTRVRAVFPAE